MGKVATRTAQPLEIPGATPVEVKDRSGRCGRVIESDRRDNDPNGQARLIAAGLELREEGKTLRAALRAYLDVFDSKNATTAVRDECVRLAAQSLVTALRAGSGARPTTLA